MKILQTIGPEIIAAAGANVATFATLEQDDSGIIFLRIAAAFSSSEGHEYRHTVGEQDATSLASMTHEQVTAAIQKALDEGRQKVAQVLIVRQVIQAAGLQLT